MQAESAVHSPTHWSPRRRVAFAIALALGASLVACSDDASPGPSGGGDGDAGCPPGSDLAPTGDCIKRIPCPDTIPEFALGLEVTGNEGRYKAKIDDASPSPPVLYHNDWVVEFTDLDGEPLDDVAITEAQCFMPAHAHGCRLPPDTEATGEPGMFDVREIGLWMYGPWEVRFQVTAANGDDYLVFPVCVE